MLRWVHTIHNLLHPCYYGCAAVYYTGPLAWTAGGLFIVTTAITFIGFIAGNTNGEE